MKCYYHPDREATTKCEKCEKLICVECKKAFSMAHHSGESSYSTQYEYCLPCYYDREIERQKVSPLENIVCIGISVVIMIFLITFDQFFSEDLGILPSGLWKIVAFFLSLIVFLDSLVFLRKKKKYQELVAELTAKKEKFLNTKQIGDSCPICGSKVDMGISICPYCGSKI